jgi:hypothetical protein
MASSFMVTHSDNSWMTVALLLLLLLLLLQVMPAMPHP